MRALVCIGLAAVLAAAALGSGCGEAVPGDTVDAAVVDTAARPDTAEPDSAAPDTGPGDTSGPDSALDVTADAEQDTSPVDTGDDAEQTDVPASHDAGDAEVDTGPPVEDCTNGIDDDGDGDTDCDDYGCAADPRCDEGDHVVYGADSCRPDDGHDDDGDGLTDCADPDCAAEPGCDESDPHDYPSGCAPDDPVDDDGDGLVSCADPDCEGSPGCDEGNAATYPDGCAPDDGVDDDGDGLTDCADPDCADAAGCDEADGDLYPDGCADGADNDGDGRTDCEDDDCQATPACLSGGDACDEPYELLLDTPFLGDTSYHLPTWGFDRGRCPGRDDGIMTDPGEGAPDAVHRFVAPAAGHYAFKVHGSFAAALYLATDCEDIDHSCLGARSSADWIVVRLDGGDVVYAFVDSISDGFFLSNQGSYTLEVTVADPAELETACTDGLDSDGDGDTDCDDFDCVTEPACDEICDNGADDDGDGRADCDDYYCLHQAACNEGVDDGASCGNGADDDHDGLSDCYDPNCAGTPACPTPLGGSCENPIVIDTVPASILTDTCPYEDDFRTLWGGPGCKTLTDPFVAGRDVIIRFVAPAAGDYLLRGDANVDKDYFGGWYPDVNVVAGAEGCPSRDFSSCLTHLDFFGFEVIDRVVVTAEAAGDVFYIVVDSDITAVCDRFALFVTEWAPEAGRCADGVDDDGDDRVDCADPDCLGDPACDEAGASASTRCHNGIDDEGDGATDCEDLDCRQGDPSGCDVVEGDLCETATLATAVPFTRDVSTCTLTNSAGGRAGDRCVSSYDGQELITRFEVPETGWYNLTATLAESATVTLDVVSEAAGCPARDYRSCVDGAAGTGVASVALHAMAGEVYFVVAGPRNATCTELSLSITATDGEDTREACLDGVDNDGDGATDGEDWRGCSGPLSEAQSGVGACHDLIDNDGNHKGDCEDGSCIAAGAVCPLVYPGDSCADPIPLTAGVATEVDLCLRRDVFTSHGGSGCGPSLAEDYRSDAVASFDVPAAGGYRLDVRWSAPNAMVNLRSEAQGCTNGHFDTCLGTIPYSGGSHRQVTDFEAAAGERYFVVLDSPNDTCATALVAIYELREDETGRCADGLDGDGDGRADCLDDDCFDDPACDEALSAGGCGDGVDGDGDGATDCVDLDCAGATGCDEAEAGSGSCDDGVDQDGDGRTDCDDAQCRLAAGACPAPPAGDLCGAPVEVPSLPYTDATRTTCDFAADYGPLDGDRCLNGTRGIDVVYRVVPDFTGVLGVTVTPLGEPVEQMTLEVSETCTDQNTLQRCVLANGAGAFTSTVKRRGVAATAGVPLYVVLSHATVDGCGPYEVDLRQVP